MRTIKMLGSEMEILIYVIVFVLGVFWLIPATVLTYKLSKNKNIDLKIKLVFLRKIWFVPIFGNVFCMLILAKTGKITKLTDSEHRGLWSGHNR
jgi:hypothetical protein